MIPAGTRITFDVQGTTGSYWVRTDEGVRADVITELMGFGTVEDVSIKRPGALEDPWTWGTGLHWPYRATVRIVTKFAHNSIDDVNSIVRGAFWNSAGEPPTVTANGYQPGQTDAMDPTTGPDPLDALKGLGI